MAPKETLRIVQFDDETRELMQEIRAYLQELRAMQHEVESMLGNFLQVATFNISEVVTDDGEEATFTFSDLE